MNSNFQDNSFYVKLGVSDNNERGETVFCVRTYIDNTPVKKILEEDFDKAMDMAKSLVAGDLNKVKVNIRAQRRAKHLILEERRIKNRKTAPESLVR